MNRNGNETESFAGNFVASDEQGVVSRVFRTFGLGEAAPDRWSSRRYVCCAAERHRAAVRQPHRPC
jgi:hypothetical protein